MLERAPRDVTALIRLGLLLCRRGAFEKAAPLFRRAGLADTRSVAARLNLAAALIRIGDEAGAVEAYAQAVEIEPSSREARVNLAYRLRCSGRLAEATGHYRRLVDDDPRDGLARWNLASLDGLNGELDKAFAGFAHPHCMRAGDLPWSLPRWTGEPLEGRVIRLEAEQGLGDAIMFARMIPCVRDAGGTVILRAQPELRGLLRGFDGVQTFAPRNEPSPPADVWAALADLPAIFGVGTAASLAERPYIRADPERLAIWGERLPATSLARVGLVWAGGPGHPDDSQRSIPLSVLMESLSKVAGAEFVSLQKGNRAEEAGATRLIRADRDIADFQDTAAALTRVDLLICVDTSVLHLAGAMGRPVWGLIAAVPDWRWMLARPDSPWYPTLRLFRQSAPRDWSTVAGEVADALAQRISTWSTTRSEGIR